MHSISYIHRQVDAESRLQRIEIMEGDGGRRRSGGNEAPIHNTQPPPERLARNRGVVEFRVREQRRVVRLWGHPSLGTPVFGDTHCPTDCSTVQAKVPVPKPSKAKVGVPMPKVGVPMPPCHHATAQLSFFWRPPSVKETPWALPILSPAPLPLLWCRSLYRSAGLSLPRPPPPRQ